MGCMGCRGGRFTLTLLGESSILQRRTYGSPQRAYGPGPIPSWDLCVTAYHACGAIQITQPPPPLILREPQHERPQPLQQWLCKGLVMGEGMNSCAGAREWRKAGGGASARFLAEPRNDTERVCRGTGMG